MYVCICNAVTDSQILAAVDAGHGTLKALRQQLGVAAECGRCARCAADLLKTCRGCGKCDRQGSREVANAAYDSRSALAAPRRHSESARLSPA